MPRFSLQFPATDIPGLASRFSYPKDDSACLAAGAEAKARGHYTLDDVILICEWKTGRTKTLVATNTVEDAEFITGEALSATDERRRMATMKWLQGVDVPTASALLFFALPADYPIIDERALESLGQKAPRYYSLKFWTEYLDACREIAKKVGVPIRTLDKALWQFSKESPS
jgi:hypothetical protein